MKIVQVEPGREPIATEIDGSLEAMQEVVGGLIQALFPYRTFFLCGAPAGCDHFTSQTDEQAEKYRALFQHPEMFLNMGGQIIVLPCD